ncbi:hypothetical protein K458DRAFT_386549 [Lentithecium fluviatile CBS 122367]|uniref:Uncharacterized protein n=1 Tax=Lentithecium fluviatile CBS 122367 TaxID=1168545 RepID=A0A6G1J8P5_9PLEO|nr:hypothetical protein K458DRAFT_386549 [Lentithecium fluviatile CBS 122367]
MGPGVKAGMPSWVPSWERKLGRGLRLEEIPKSQFRLDLKSLALEIRALAVGKVVEILEMPEAEAISDLYSLRRILLELHRKWDKSLRLQGLSRAARRAKIREFWTLLDFVFCEERPSQKRKTYNDSSSSSSNVASPPGSGDDSDENEEAGSRFLQPRSALHDFLEHRNSENSHTKPSSLPRSTVIVPEMKRFFLRARHLVVGTELFGYVSEDVLPDWRRGDKLVLIPEYACALTLRPAGKGWKYVYRVALLNFTDQKWKMRKKWFEGAKLEDVTLI